jgi:hypothetical protein
MGKAVDAVAPCGAVDGAGGIVTSVPTAIEWRTTGPDGAAGIPPTRPAANVDVTVDVTASTAFFFGAVEARPGVEADSGSAPRTRDEVRPAGSAMMRARCCSSADCSMRRCTSFAEATTPRRASALEEDDAG